MGTLSKPYIFTGGTFAVASQVNANFDTVFNWINGGAGMWSDGSTAFSGNPLLPNTDPTNNNHATRKLYVDSGLTNLTRGPVSVAARPGASTRVDYVVIGVDKAGYHAFGNVGAPLSSWEKLGGTLRAVNCVWTGDGQFLLAIGYGVTQTIYLNYTTVAGPWTGWFPMPSGMLPAS